MAPLPSAPVFSKNANTKAKYTATLLLQAVDAPIFTEKDLLDLLTAADPFIDNEAPLQSDSCHSSSKGCLLLSRPKAGIADARSRSGRRLGRRHVTRLSQNGWCSRATGLDHNCFTFKSRNVGTSRTWHVHWSNIFKYFQTRDLRPSHSSNP